MTTVTRFTAELQTKVDAALRYLAARGTIISSNDVFWRLGVNRLGNTRTSVTVYNYINNVVKLKLFRVTNRDGRFRYLWHTGSLRPKKKNP